jgi:hypothetical protein
LDEAAITVEDRYLILKAKELLTPYGVTVLGTKGVQTSSGRISDASIPQSSDTATNDSQVNPAFSPYFGDYEGSTNGYSMMNRDGIPVVFNGNTVDAPSAHVKVSFSKSDGEITLDQIAGDNDTSYSGHPNLMSKTDWKIHFSVISGSDPSSSDVSPVYDFEFSKDNSGIMYPFVPNGEPKTTLLKAHSN